MIKRLSESSLRRIFWLFRGIPGWFNHLMKTLHVNDLIQLEDWDEWELKHRRHNRKVEKAWMVQARKMSLALRDSVVSVLRLPPPKSGGLTQDQIQIAKDFEFPRLVNSEVGEKILCQWHQDNNESMTVYLNGAYCFVCHKNVDSIQWLRETEGLSFYDSVMKLNTL